MALTSAFTSINLPVKNAEQSKAFFTGLGFELNPQFPDNENSAAVMIGDNLQVMLIEQTFFNTLTEKETVDTLKYAQMTLALAVESREKVDEIVNTAVSLGGKLHAEPEDHGPSMYHWGFVDLDGHLWAINYMNMDAAQKQGGD
ncbi:VOC family protein [Saccharibacillus sp. CPCC 101409]|uniref:VOC family protein n=1 Tax=Saccharibacillus sp. CPCC 101409 TaxID=3058041 RepID=UPI002672DA8C|nr:VOC family protein [Saccharibacillus sp. CPCC 101409]MDO3410594.1 VOC family protein [Saccharibacillus sp. CPCC 101409]